MKDRVLTSVECGPMDDDERGIIPLQWARILIIQHDAIRVYRGHRHCEVQSQSTGLNCKLEPAERTRRFTDPMKVTDNYRDTKVPLIGVARRVLWYEENEQAGVAKVSRYRWLPHYISTTQRKHMDRNAHDSTVHRSD